MIHHYLRNVTLGTSLTALFLLLRCSVPGRDYSQLGIGQNAGSGGSSGLDGDDILHGSAGLGGLGGEGGLGDAGSDQGGQAGTGPVFVPIPCVELSNDAGTEDAGADAGSEDAGTEDAGTEDAVCECVDGFLRGVDADGDGERTRACTLAPGLDCDDGDNAVTHNSCGGCSALPPGLGEDCLDCGAYICDGTDAIVCATKPDPLVDPDCQCVAAQIVARDVDADGEGTRLCEFNPGNDCNDGDNSFTTNQCGGCAELPGAVGGGCNECGVYQCNGTALVCVPNPAELSQCVGSSRQSCINNGYWDTPVGCANVCYAGNCETCTPGTFRCTFYSTGDAVSKCVTDASLGNSSYGIGWTSWGSCSSTTLRCNPANGACTTGYFLLPRDRTFDVVPLLHPGLPWHEVLNTASDSDYG